MATLRAHSTALSTALGLALATSVASGQSFVLRRPVAQIRQTGIFARVGFVTSVFDAANTSFAAQLSREERELRGVSPAFTGKQLGWGYLALPGLTFNVSVDARWFYVRAGADVYLNPEVTFNPELYRARHTSQAFLGAGPRIAVGDRWALQVGIRVGALFMNVVTDNRRGEYSAIEGIGAVDVGLQWRPTRWCELDLTVGQDVLSAVHMTTVGLAASFGYTRGR